MTSPSRCSPAIAESEGMSGESTYPQAQRTCCDTLTTVFDFGAVAVNGSLPNGSEPAKGSPEIKRRKPLTVGRRGGDPPEAVAAVKAGNVGMKEAATEEEAAVVVGRAGALKAPNRGGVGHVTTHWMR